MYTLYNVSPTITEEMSQNLINEMIKLIFSKSFCLAGHDNILKNSVHHFNMLLNTMETRHGLDGQRIES
jgi:hypothetical protein